MKPSVRALRGEDADAALSLYAALTLGPTDLSAEAFMNVLAHPGTTVFGAEHDGKILGMVTLHLLPNVTWHARPYALVENVVTDPEYRKRGIGRAVMETALSHAWDANAYKVMLMTGQYRGAQGFYTALGFSSEDKTAMVIRSA